MAICCVANKSVMSSLKIAEKHLAAVGIIRKTFVYLQRRRPVREFDGFDK